MHGTHAVYHYQHEIVENIICTFIYRFKFQENSMNEWLCEIRRLRMKIAGERIWKRVYCRIPKRAFLRVFKYIYIHFIIIIVAVTHSHTADTTEAEGMGERRFVAFVHKLH